MKSLLFDTGCSVLILFLNTILVGLVFVNSLHLFIGVTHWLFVIDQDIQSFKPLQ